MIVRERKGVTVIHAKSFFDFVDSSATDHSDMDTTERLSRSSDSRGWSGVSSFREALELAEHGWPEGLQLLNRLSKATFEKLSEVVQKPVVIYSDEPPGIDFDIARVLIGEPEHWVHIVEPQARGMAMGPVRIVANGSISSNVSPEVIQAKGAAIATLIMLMEYSGRPVELVCAYGVGERPTPIQENAGKRVEVYVTIKKADQFLNPLLLAFALGHPAMTRRFLLSTMECLKGSYRDALSVPGYYGYPAEVSHVGDLYVFSGITFPGMVSDWRDSRQVQDWVLWQLNQQGVSMTLGGENV